MFWMIGSVIQEKSLVGRFYIILGFYHFLDPVNSQFNVEENCLLLAPLPGEHKVARI